MATTETAPTKGDTARGGRDRRSAGKAASTGETVETESDRLARAAFDFALREVLSYLDHGEVRAKCGPVSRGWSEAASRSSRCEGRLGPDMGFVFGLLDLLVTDDSFGLMDSEPGEFQLENLGDVVVFEPHLPVQTFRKRQDVSPQYAAVVTLDQDAVEGLLGVKFADLAVGQDMGELGGVTLNERFIYEEEEDESVCATVLSVSKSDSHPGQCTLELCFDFTRDGLFDFYDALWQHATGLKVVGRGHEKLWELHQHQPAREGVIKADGDVPAGVSAALRDGITHLAARPLRDYHPGSNNVVRDHVHPGLFPFVKGESEFRASKDLPTAEPRILKKWPVPHALPHNGRNFGVEDEGTEDNERSEAIVKDRWGRPYEDSEYQWLPSYFDVSSTGQVAIRGEINHLRPRDAHAGLYEALEGLFQTFLPDLAAVLTYADSISFINEDAEGGDEVTRDESLKLKHLVVKDNLHGSSLQVITKIVDYELKPGQTHEGVWHVEGMSHEHVVATCLYVVDRDDWVTGGDLLFKRAFTQLERNTIFWNVGQERDQVSQRMFDEGLVPLGCQPTPAGR